jgi:hypothetical protein
MIGGRTAGNVGDISSELPHRQKAGCSCSEKEPKSPPEEVRASVVAKKRVTTVEPRDAGK